MPQYRLFSGRQTSERINASSLITNQSLQAKCCRAGSHIEQTPGLLCEAVIKKPWRPERHYPATAHGTKIPIAHSVFLRQIDGPAIDPNWIKHPCHFSRRERSKAYPCGHKSQAVPSLYKCGPLLRPTPRNVAMDERVLPELDAAPVTDLRGIAIGP